MTHYVKKGNMPNLTIPESVNVNFKVTDTKSSVSRSVTATFDLSKVTAEELLKAALRSWVIEVQRPLRADLPAEGAKVNFDASNLGRTRDPKARDKRAAERLSEEDLLAIVKARGLMPTPAETKPKRS